MPLLNGLFCAAWLQGLICVGALPDGVLFIFFVPFLFFHFI